MGVAGSAVGNFQVTEVWKHRVDKIQVRNGNVQYLFQKMLC